MQPTYSEPVDFVTESTCFLVRNALDDAECLRLIEQASDLGFLQTGLDYPSSYRDNDRLVRDDPGLATALFERLGTLLPERLVDDDGVVLRLVGLNERFRYCRYGDGQCFRVHRDGAHARSEGERSRLTVQIYLDDGFSGGRTRFFDSRFGACIGAVQPVRGTAIVFDHALFHDGEPVIQGRKHVLRTDVIYAREAALPLDDAEVLRGHLGYVYRVITLADGRLASASRDRTVRLWDGGDSVVLRGHRGSVHALVEAEPGVLWSGSRDHTLRAFRPSDGASHEVANLGCAALSLDRWGSRIVCGSADGVVRLFSHDGSYVEHRGHDGWVWAVTAVGDAFVSGAEDGCVRLWNEHGCIDVANAHRGAVHSLARIGEGSIAAGFADGHVIVYAIERGTLQPIEVLAAHEGEVYALLALDGGLLASGGEDSCVRVHRLRDRALVAEVRHGDFVRSLACAPSGQLASASYDGTIRLTRVGAAPRDRACEADSPPARSRGPWPCRSSEASACRRHVGT